MIRCSVTVVGDGNVGKTCLLLRYVKGEVPPDQYVPTVFELHSDTVTYDGVDVNLQLLDTAGQEDYEKLRVIAYHKCDVFLLCYDVNNPASLDNCKTKWIKELRLYNKKCPVILVGTKLDLLSDSTSMLETGDKLAKKIKAAGHILTSSMNGEGVIECFEKALDLRINGKKKRWFC